MVISHNRQLPPARVLILLLATLLLTGLAAPGRGQDSALIFNEIQYHPANELAETEWIELRSLQAVDVDIGGWRIEGGINFTFPNNYVMPGGGYLVIAAIPGQIPGALGPFTGQLDNGGETLRIVNRNGRVMDEVSYDDESNWPVGPDGSGATLARTGFTAEGGAKTWSTSLTIGGTPGVKNFAEATDPPTVTTLIPLSTTWKYLDNNVAPPVQWTSIAFNEAGWSSGGSLLYAGSPNVSGAGEGLHGYWPLQETSGTTAPNAAPGGGTAGALNNGPVWITNDPTRGRVLSFDGVDDYVDAGFLPLMTLSNNFTWSFWTFSTQTGGNVILGNRYGPSGGDWNPREFIKFTSDAFQYDTNNVLFIDYANVPGSAWVHHALVKQGTTLTYYRNGTPTNSATITAPQNNAQPFYFGGDKAAERWSGRLDDIAVWTKALPPTSIAGLANNTLTPLTAPTGGSGVPLTTPLAQGPTTHYFRKAFNFNGAKERTTLTLQHMLDDGAVVYLNGEEVLRVNMPGGAVTHTTPASTDITSTALSTAQPISTNALVNGPNVLSVEVHQHPTNADMVFGVNLVASETPALPSGGSLVFSEFSAASEASFVIELQNKSGTAANTSGWTITTSEGGSHALPAQMVPAGGFVTFTAADIGLTATDGLRLFLRLGSELRDSREITNRRRGLTAEGRWGHPTTPTPGAANVVVVSDAIVINEIFYHAIEPSEEQWVELHNRSGAPVDISLWKFTDGMSYQFPAGTAPIPAGGYVVVSWNPATFATLHAGVPSVGPFDGSLSGNGETITLRDHNDNIADQVTYADGGRWSKWADGGGSSLELIDADADNSKPEAWDASDESGKSTWQTVTAASYQGLASNPNGPDPTTYNEFVFGLLNDGEFLIDDISVKNVNLGNVELIQNVDFSGGTTAGWRIIGNHLGTIVDDPTAPGNKVLKITAASATEHMHNHAETTLKQGASYHSINAGQTYSISFRAKWLRGSNRLHTRLWHNRLARQTELNRPATGGTPGAPNSRAAANVGPTFDALAATPTVPPAGQTATVSVKVEDPQGIASVQLFTSVNGAGFTNVAMSTSGNGVYTGTVGAQAAGALVQFYVRATDTLGAQSFFPAGGASSRAMIPWSDGRAQLQLPSGARPHNIRVVVPTADATQMYKRENLMSDLAIPCTVIFNESRAYYTAGVRLKSSEHGRISEARCGYTLEFGADDLFMGIHDTISIDRSGGVVTGQKEILLRRLMNTAGGIYASEDDLVRVISAVGGSSPTTQFTGAGITGAAIMSKTRLDKDYLDAQFDNGGDGAMQKYERVYVLTQTVNPATGAITTIDGANVLTSVSEQPKIPQDNTGPPGVNVQSLGANKENYRWYWLIQNARDADDYTGIINVTGALGASNQTLMAQHINVSAWLRATVPATLFGVIDNYLGSGGGQHNALVYFPPGQKAVLIPWDMDFLDQGNSSSALTNGGDIGKFTSNPVWKRIFWGHMHDILDRSFNPTYMNTWAAHYSRFGTDDMTSSVSGYLTPRASFAATQITANIPSVTFSASGPANVATPFATVTGNGWVNVAEIRLQGTAEPLAVTWTGQSTYSLQLPLNIGSHSYTLVAYNPRGVQVGTATVTINYTGTLLPAGPGSFVISELNYNPPGSGDATEFVELLNITATARDLGNCHFDEENGQGFDYTFPPNTQVPAGGRIIVARDRAAFQAAYPSFSGTLAPNQFEAGDALDNAGEMIVLYAANGQEILRTDYPDQPESTDGSGRTLVRVLSSTSPNPNSNVWRESTVDGGNPGGTDSTNFAGSAIADADGDGYKAVLEYVFGTSDTTTTIAPWTVTRNVAGEFLVTFPRMLQADDAVLTIETTTNFATPFTTATATLVGSTTAGNVVTETWKITPPVGAPQFFVQLKAALR